jgi:photosystem II stability/assembly factor-like uncharacterized protein
VVEYGTTSSYGNSVMASGLISGVGPQILFIPVSGLFASTSYQFRVKAFNAIDTSYSNNNSFTTANASEVWTKQESGQTEPLQDVVFVSDSIAFAVAGNQILKTTNVGSTWSAQLNPGGWSVALGFADRDTGVTMHWGAVSRTTNAGASWSYISTNINGWMNAIRFVNPSLGIAAGYAYDPSTGSYPGTIAKTTNAGASWNIIRQQGPELYDVFVINKDTVFASGGSGTILRTYNFTATAPNWDSLATGTTNWLYGIAFFNKDTGVAVSPGVVRRTTDGGATWSNATTSSSPSLLSIAVKNSKVAVAAGYSGHVFRSTDAGGTWTREQSGTLNSLYTVVYRGRHALAGGDYGSIIRAIDPLAEGEPNNTLAEAQAMNYNDQVDAAIETGSDVDYYKFTAASADTVEVYLININNSSLNAQIDVRNSSDAVLSGASNDDYVAGDQTQARVATALPGAGTFYIRVSSVGGTSTGEYRIRLRKTSLKPVIYSSGSVTNLTPTAATLNGTIVPNNLSTTVTFKWGTVGNFNNVTAASQSPISGQQRQAVTLNLSSLTSNTDYNFRVVSQNAAGTDSGAVIAFHTPAQAAFAELEPNDDTTSAQVIAYGDSVDAKIVTPTDVDYFAFHASGIDTVEIFIVPRGTSTLTPRIEVRSETGSQYVNTSFFPSGDRPHAIAALPGAGKYFVRITYSGNFNTNFPFGVEDSDLQIAPAQSAEVATNDTGEYKIFIRRFVPSAPEFSAFSNFFSRYWDNAVLGGSVRANGLSTTVSLEYGPTTSYGTTVPIVQGTISGMFQTTVYGWLTGLSGNTTYNYRLFATNSAGTTTSDNFTFVTPKQGDGWAQQQSGVTELLNDVHFVNASTGIVVGNLGRILKTTNGGGSWQTQTSAWGSTINGVWLVDANVAFAVGSSGSIQKTTDGGANWTNQFYAGNPFLRKVQFVNSSVGYAVGNGIIIKTTDSGASWFTSKSTTVTCLALSFVDANNGFVVGTNGIVFRTTDGGSAWDSLATLGTTSTVFAVKFFNSNTGVVSYSNTIARTTNAGATWTTVSDPSVVTNTILGMGFNDVSNGIAVATSGGLYRTYDGGQTWTGQQSGTLNTLRRISFASRHAYSVGDFGTFINSVGLLAIPTGLVAVYDSLNLVTVSWTDNAQNETGYLVERKTGSGGTYSLIRTTGAISSGTASIVDTVLRGNIYSYRTRAFSVGDTSAYSAEDTTLVPLAVPSNFDAVSASATQIDLFWQNIVDARDGYKIERKTGAGGTYSEIATVGSALTSYQNTGLTPGTRYYYRIRSYNSILNSSYSTEDSAMTALGKPVSLSASPSTVTNQPITISWTSPAGATNAWYTIDAPPTGGTPGTQRLVTGNSFVISSPPLGARWVYVYLENVEGGRDMSTFDSVQTRFDNIAPTVQDQTPSTALDITISGSSVSSPSGVTISASVSKSSGIAALRFPTLQYKKTNSTTIDQAEFLSTSGGNLPLPTNLNSLFFTNGKPNGAEYRIVAADEAGNVTTSAWRSFNVFVSSTTVSASPLPGAGDASDNTTLVKSYRIFSVPFDLQDKKPGSFMETSDRGLGPHASDGVNYYNWRMQRYVNNNYEDYESFKNSDVLTPGAGFFLISRVQKHVTVGAGNLVKAQDMFSNGIPVLSGWNLVGNPFPDSLSTDSMYVVSGSITTKAYYDGNGPDAGWWRSGSQVQTLRAWEGLAINVTAATSLRFRVLPQQPSREEEPQTPLAIAITAAKAIEEDKANGWLMKFGARRVDNGMMDVENTIGMAPHASEGYDQYDAYQPPVLSGKNVALYFRNTDGAMSDDIRPINEDGATWEMRVMTGDKGARITMTSEQLIPLPAQTMQAYLLDLDEKMAFNLRERSEVDFNSKEGLRNFRVVVGTKQYVDSLGTLFGIDLIPRTMTLFQNYPNPFNPETVIRFTIPGPDPVSRVSLKLYNIIGQEVLTIVDDDLPSGYYERMFNGRNLASGTYIYRIVVTDVSKARTFVDVKKMLLIK